MANCVIILHNQLRFHSLDLNIYEELVPSFYIFYVKLRLRPGCAKIKFNSLISFSITLDST